MSSTRQESHDVGLFEPPLIEQTIGRCFEAVVAKFPKNEALVSYQQGLRYTYEELNDEAEQLASALLELGLSQGDRVGIWSHNNAQWLITQLATAKVGIVLVNINPAYRSSELEYALNKVGCRALIAMPTFKTTNYLDLIREVAPEVSTSEFGGLSAKRVPELRWVIHLGAELVPGMARFEDLTKTGVLNDPRVRSAGEVLSPSDPINIQFTSGTTGFPKGATLSHRNILNNGFLVGEAMRFTPVDRLCVPVPLVRSEVSAHGLHGGVAMPDRGHAPCGR
jgi:fatty-acyl-CoA synthase